MSKHTPGPWKILPEECDKSYIRVRGTYLGSRYKVANVLTPIYEGVAAREAEETRANARLISAAPDLLEALTALVSYCERRGMDTETVSADHMDSARAAINKATGEQV